MGLLHPARRSMGFHTTALVTLAAFTWACYGWSVVPLQAIEAQPTELKHLIRVTPLDGGAPMEMEVKSVDYPYVTGVVTEAVALVYDRGGLVTDPSNVTTERVVTLDLRQASEIEVRSFSGVRTAVFVVGMIGLVAAVAALIVLLTKTSCPFVYVDDGTGNRFVGEVYSGATSRATQREDLLPLPSLGLRPNLVLSNEARETQFTDVLEVVLVDRAPGSRTLATHDARLVLVGDPQAPRTAKDLEGNDVLERVRAADGRAWLGDLDGAARRADPPLREGVVATFSTSPDGGPLALQLDVANSPWLDVVFGRFFALLGDRLDGYLDDADRPDAREPSLAWREREGVDLRVEVERGGHWQRVAVIPTVGPASHRRVAVRIGSAAGDEVRVRVSGGVGFWQLDGIALARIEPPPPAERHVAPARAVERDGSDVRERFARTDGVYQVLRAPGDRVNLAFELPPSPPGLERDAFLRTAGYYRVHTPPQSELSAGTLFRLRDEPGSLSRFSVDLYRGYLKVAPGPVAAAPPRSGSGAP